MTDESATIRKLPILKTVAQTWAFPFRHLREFWRLFWPAYLLILTSNIVFYILTFASHLDFIYRLSRTPSDQRSILEYVYMTYAGSFRTSVFLAIFCFFATPLVTAWHRFVVQGEAPFFNWRNLAFGKRELHVFLLLYGFILLYRLLLGGRFGRMINFFVTYADDFGVPDPGRFHFVVLFFLLGGAAYLAVTRMALLLPSAANGETPSLHRAWTIARGNGFRFIAIVVLFAIVLVVAGFLSGSLIADGMNWIGAAAPSFMLSAIHYTSAVFATFIFFSNELFGTFYDLVTCFLATTALSLCYRHLIGGESGKTAPTADP